MEVLEVHSRSIGDISGHMQLLCYSARRNVAGRNVVIREIKKAKLSLCLSEHHAMKTYFVLVMLCITSLPAVIL